MAIDTTQITTLYTTLSGLAEGTLDKFIQNFSMAEPTKAQVLSNTIVALIQTSANQAQQQPLIDAQIAQATAQTNAIIGKASIDATQSEKDILIKDAQITLITAQVSTEVTKQALNTRQTTYYNDQLRVEKGKQYSTITGMTSQAGTTVPTDLWTATFTAVNNII